MAEASEQPTTRRALARHLLVAAPVAALALWVTLFAPRGFFSGDSGVKFAQAHALWESGFSSRALPGRDQRGPCDHFYPYGRFVHKVGHDRQGIYSVSFTALSAPFVGLLGLAGVVVLPLLGGILIGVGARFLLRRLGCSELASTLAVVTTLFLTPVGFYSSQFAEHTLAAGLILCGLVFLVPQPSRFAAIWVGLLVGLAATVRPEGYCAAASMGLAVVAAPACNVRRRILNGLLYLGAALAVMTAYWCVNEWLSGTWDPLVHHNKDHESSWKNARMLLFGKLETKHLYRWFIPLIVAATAALVPLPRRWHYPRLGLRAAAGCVLVYYLWSAHVLGTGRTAMGLFSVTAIAAYGLVGGPWSSRLRPLWLFAVTFIIQVLHYDSSGTSGGLQLGARLLMPALPVLIVLATVHLEHDWRASRHRLARLALAPALALLILTGRTMVDALPEALDIARDSEVSVKRAASIPARVVVTRRSWESQVLAPVRLLGKRIYNKHGDATPLIRCLTYSGVQSFVFVAAPDVELTLPGPYEPRSVARFPGPLHMHHVLVRPKEPPPALRAQAPQEP